MLSNLVSVLFTVMWGVFFFSGRVEETSSKVYYVVSLMETKLDYILAKLSEDIHRWVSGEGIIGESLRHDQGWGKHFFFNEERGYWWLKVRHWLDEVGSREERSFRDQGKRRCRWTCLCRIAKTDSCVLPGKRVVSIDFTSLLCSHFIQCLPCI